LSNANYQGYAIFAAEQSLARQFKLMWSEAHPLQAILKEGKGRFNKGIRTEGFKMIIPLNFEPPTIPAQGVSDANEFTPLVPTATNGFTQAEYEYTHYRGAFWLRNSEQRLLKNGARGNILEGKTNQLKEDFKRQISTDYASATAASRTKVLGLRHVTSAANTVGGIDQAAQAWWRGRVRTGAGPFMLDLLDEQYDGIVAQGRAKPDLVLASYSPSVNVFQKIRSAIAPAERIVNAGDTAKYGFVNFQYLTMMVAMDNRLGTAAPGSAMVLSTDTWYIGGDETPRAAEVIRIPGTSVDEFYWDWWVATGTNDPGSNALITGIS
jgi:hypothetical protein